MTITTKQLAKAETDYKIAFQRAEGLRFRRNAAVRKALKEGWTHAQIADATGLSRGRINQMR